MGKRAGRWKQALALLLTVSCVACSVPCMEPTHAENMEETVEIMGTEGGENETEEKAGEMKAEPETAGMENTTEDMEEEGVEETVWEPEAAEHTVLEPEKTDVEPGKTKKEDGGSEVLPIEVVSAVSASESAEADEPLNADYTDSNGVTYSYYGYGDGTAEIHTIMGYEGKDVDIPGETDGYIVTEIQAKLPFGANLISMTIPESVTCMGDRIFWGVNIGTLYYNAAEITATENNASSPFSAAKIGEFHTGERVRLIPAEMFSSATFTGIVALTAAEVDSNAFSFAEFAELTLTDRVKTLHGNAFANAQIQSLHYNTHAKHTAGEVTAATFYQARVDALDIGAGIREMPGYVFSGAHFSFHEFTVDLERVGDYAFYNVFPLYDPYEAEITVTENVKYMGACALARCDITTLHMDADMETGASDSLTGVFYSSDVGNLVIGESVTQIPDYLFSNTNISQEELALDVERIGKCAFYDCTVLTDLTIGENVKDIGMKAFCSSEITNIHYNASNATVGGEAEMKAAEAPFFSVAFSHISFGNQVESIPGYLFAAAEFSVEDLALPDTVTSIGIMAFYSAMSDDITIGNLTVGADVSCIGKSAFGGCTIGKLSYLAENAGITGMEKAGDSPFYGAEIGSLAIRESVAELPAYILCGISITQDNLVIPDSVRRIGQYAFSDKSMLWGGIETGTLTIGKNVSYIGANAFENVTIDRAVVNAVRADDEYKSLSFTTMELPICTYTEIHKGSDFYPYFTKRTSDSKVTSLCRDFETVYGEGYFDSGTSQFVTPFTKSCVVCGYVEDGQDMETAHMVRFVDFDGRVLSSQGVKNGSSAIAPESPSRTGYNFTGWDKEFGNVTEDLTVTALYEIQKFTVMFKDGDTVLEEQQVEYGGDAQPPKNPSRPPEEWGNWQFDGWEGDFRHITEDMVIQAKFRQEWNEYEVVFYDAEGKELSVQTVAYGKGAETPEIPKKSSDVQYDYEFSGWSADYTEVKADLSIYPQYDSKIRSYTVTFLDAEDNLLDSQTVEYGSGAVPPENPQKKPTAQYEYRFKGWDCDIEKVSKDMVARPMYEAEVRSYKITFADGDTVFDVQDVEYGGDAQPPENPSRQEEKWGIWKFVEWLGNFFGITKDETVQAVFEKVLNRYAVTFYDEKGGVIETQFVEHGSAAVAPEAPGKESDAEFWYDFTGWDGDISNITETSEFHPVYESRTRSYSVVFLDAEGEILSSQTVKYGCAAEVPETPEKETDVWNTYAFIGWSGDYMNVQEDMVLYPLYEDLLRTYTVTFADGKTIIDRQEVDAGDDAEVPETPEREKEVWGIWKFAGWEGNYENVLKDETVQAIFEKELNVYSVIFEDAEGNAISKQEIRHGFGAVPPDAPAKERDEEYEYIFQGWDGDTEKITEDTVFCPVYQERTRCYTVTFMSEGEVIDTQSVEYGNAATEPTAPVKENDEKYSYTFTGWDGEYDFITEDVVIHALFERVELPPGDDREPDDGGEPDDGKELDDDKEPDGEKEPDDGREPDDDREPDNDREPDDDKKPDGDKEPDKEPDDNGKEPISEQITQTDTVPVPESDSEKEPHHSGMEKEEKKRLDEPKTRLRKTGEKSEETEHREKEEREKSGNFGALLFIVLLVVGLLLFLLFLLLYYCRRKICGTVQRHGEPVKNLLVTLERTDIADREGEPDGRDMWTARTDADGCFCFANLEKGSYQVNFPCIDGNGRFSVAVHMEEKEGNVFDVPAFCGGVETEKNGSNYVVDVKV